MQTKTFPLKMTQSNVFSDSSRDTSELTCQLFMQLSSVIFLNILHCIAIINFTFFLFSPKRNYEDGSGAGKLRLFHQFLISFPVIAFCSVSHLQIMKRVSPVPAKVFYLIESNQEVFHVKSHQPMIVFDTSLKDC